MKPAARVTAAFALILLVLPVTLEADQGKRGSHRRAMHLPATGQWYDGQDLYRADTPLDRTGFPGSGYYTVYLAELEPGRDYTLGLRYPADSGASLSVNLFDRWPFAPEARRYRLPMGPVVRTDPDWIEYRWRLGVSSRSQGNLAFVVVETSSPGAWQTGRFRHFMYLVTPAVRSMNQPAAGITYLRGPSDLFLPQTTDRDQFAVEYPYDGPGPGSGPGTDWRPGGGLIFNGDFSQGLQGWELFSEGEGGAAVDHVASGKDGLRIWSDGQAALSGVRQTVQRDIQEAGSLVLEMELRIDKDPGTSSRGNGAAVELAVCYLDAEAVDHCGDEAYRVGFTAHRQAVSADGTIEVSAGQWFSFTDDLMDLDPGPRVIKSVAITGGHNPGQNAWVRLIHLTERGGMK